MVAVASFQRQQICGSSVPIEYLISASLSEEGTLFILIKMVPYSQTLAAQQTRQTSLLPACRRLYTGRCVKMSDCLRMSQRQAQRIWAQGLERRLQTNGALICEALLTKIKGVFQRTDWEERCRDLREHACLQGSQPSTQCYQLQTGGLWVRFPSGAPKRMNGQQKGPSVQYCRCAPEQST